MIVSLFLVTHHLCGHLINVCLWDWRLFCLFIIFTTWTNSWHIVDGCFLLIGRMDAWMNESLFVLHIAARGFLLLDQSSYGSFPLMPSNGFTQLVEYFFMTHRAFTLFPQCTNPVKLPDHPVRSSPPHFCPSLDGRGRCVLVYLKLDQMSLFLCL